MSDGFCEGINAFYAKTFNQRFYYETVSGNSPGGSRRDYILYSTDRKSSVGLRRRRNTNQFRRGLHFATNPVRLVGDRRFVRPLLAPDADRGRLAALQ